MKGDWLQNFMTYQSFRFFPDVHNLLVILIDPPFILYKPLLLLFPSTEMDTKTDKFFLFSSPKKSQARRLLLYY
uniref:Uncharacterized protein n=1 Tax=Glossina palpalis gambiensis TaxID=67801 RepID=A0A1B0B6U1_9MUSC